MKVYAMYLPQFHRIPENDEWWGEGFTEWTAVKNAKSLFEGHNQPRIPLNEYYYDLMDKKTMEWQTQLMHKYGIDGMCFYHYWFKGGKRVLEKPAENLLQWDDVDMPFCFCWANESWTRTWKGLSNTNTWSSEYKGRDHSSKYLLEQSYGKEDDWKEHFCYLLPFFLDKRYIRIDDKPVFIFYQASFVDCLEEMIAYWDKLAKEHDLKGIFIIVSNTKGLNYGCADGILDFQPSSCLNYSSRDSIEGISVFSYDEIWSNILTEQKLSEKFFRCGIVSFDTTPRKGKYGVVMQGVTANKFEKYFTKLLAKANEEKSEIVFLTAWNEWGEGNYLEPDVDNQFNYLEAVKNAKNNYEIYSNAGDYSFSGRQIYAKKMQCYFDFMDRWMTFREEGKSISQNLEKKSIKKIYIYGYGAIGRHLEAELKNSNIEICGIIDKRNLSLSDYKVFLPSEKLSKADAIIITPFFYIESIIDDLNIVNPQIAKISITELILY